jgi:hypothetical protein
VVLWKSVILTIVICGLLILGGSTIITESVGINDTLGPAGIVAESSNDSPIDFVEKYRGWLDMLSVEDDDKADVDENAVR